MHLGGRRGKREGRPMAPIFLNKTYDEALGLLVEARDYLAHKEPSERRAVAVGDRLIINCEAMRVTSRLTQVMAWLLIQKAVDAGELSPVEATAEQHRLSGQEVCRQRDAFGPIEMPNGLRSLLDRSYRLYERVERLDAMVAAGAEDWPMRRPAQQS
jgi:regulator of CtrA degradation